MPTEQVTTTSDIFLFPDKEYGIVGGGANETALMQAAIDAASAQGRIVILPAFSVTVTTLTLPSGGVEIWGQLGLAGQPRSELLSTGINAPILRTTANSRRLVLKNFKVTGTSSGTSQHGIQFGGNDSALMELEGLYIRLCGGNGIHIGSTDYSYILKDIYSSANSGHQFYIDAVNSPCVMLQNCYAGVVTTNKYGFYVPRGTVEFVNCNSLDGGSGNLSCVAIGESAIGVATGIFRNCNFESFTTYGVIGDIGSDVILHNCSFVAPGSGTVQPLYLIQPTGASYIDSATYFLTGGATYDNASNLPIKVFDRGIFAPFGNNFFSSRVNSQYFNSQAGRAEPLGNSGMRLPAVSVTAASYTEDHPIANYFGVNRAGAVTVTLFDSQAATIIPNRIVVIKDESGNASVNNITVNVTNARTIDGAASLTINTNYGRITLVHRGNNYWRID